MQAARRMLHTAEYALIHDGDDEPESVAAPVSNVNISYGARVFKKLKIPSTYCPGEHIHGADWVLPPVATGPVQSAQVASPAPGSPAYKGGA